MSYPHCLPQRRGANPNWVGTTTAPEEIASRQGGKMRLARPIDLLFISKSPKAKLDMFKAGISLETRTGYSLAELVDKATNDRLILGREFIRHAKNALGSQQPCYRSAVSRSYYSMYHVFRGVTYYVTGGDDHEDHTKLPSAIPADFPSQGHWENDLKSARFDRNRADYDPYPRNDRQFAAAAARLLGQADALLPIARAYLRGRGCRI